MYGEALSFVTVDYVVTRKAGMGNWCLDASPCSFSVVDRFSCCFF